MQTPINQPAIAVAEPFGQRGVRRFVFPALANCSLLLMVLSLAMWARSYHVREWMDCVNSNRRWYISSVWGRLLIVWESTSRENEPWSYGQDPMHRIVNDAWQDGWWKRIGIEAGRGGVPSGRVSPPFRRESWIRIRWPFIAVVAMILPVVRLVQDRSPRRRWSRARLRGKLDDECPRCGRTVGRFVHRCPYCGAGL